MAESPNIRISAKVRGIRRVKAHLQRYAAAVPAVLAQKRIQKLLLRRTKERLGTKGSNARAQKDPDGKSWEPLKDITIKDKARLGYPANRALVRTKSMLDAIRIVRSSMSGSILRTYTGGGFSIGIAGSKDIVDKASAHQFGTMSGWGNKVRIPKRRFLGIGNEDVSAVNRLLRRLYNREVGGT